MDKESRIRKTKRNGRILRILLLCAGAVMCAIFLTVVKRIEERQTTIIRPDAVTMDALKEEYGEGKVFEEFLEREDFGEFYELELVWSPKVPEFQKGQYYFADLQMVGEITDILGDYRYYQVEAGENLVHPDLDYLIFRLRGKHETDLVVRICQVFNNPEMVLIELWAENIAGSVSEDMLWRWHSTVSYVDSGVLERVMGCLEEHVGLMSLQMAEEKIASVGNQLASSEFLCMDHEEKEQYSNHETNEGYIVYTQPLCDYQGYLQLYEVYFGSSAMDGYHRERFIFKVELYDIEGNFQRELYLDMEDYNRAWGKGE